MSTLAQFLKNRIAENEAAARAAADEASHGDGDGMHWRTSEDGNVYEGQSNSCLAVGPWASDLREVGLHIARQDPAHVLARCRADTALLEDHCYRHVCEDGMAGEDPARDAYYRAEYGEDLQSTPCSVLRAMGLAYTDHPDYQQQWAPAPEGW